MFLFYQRPHGCRSYMFLRAYVYIYIFIYGLYWWHHYGNAFPKTTCDSERIKMFILTYLLVGHSSGAQYFCFPWCHRASNEINLSVFFRHFWWSHRLHGELLFIHNFTAHRRGQTWRALYKSVSGRFWMLGLLLRSSRRVGQLFPRIRTEELRCFDCACWLASCFSLSCRGKRECIKSCLKSSGLRKILQDVRNERALFERTNLTARHLVIWWWKEEALRSRGCNYLMRYDTVLAS